MIVKGLSIIVVDLHLRSANMKYCLLFKVILYKLKMLVQTLAMITEIIRKLRHKCLKNVLYLLISNNIFLLNKYQTKKKDKLYFVI